MRPGNDIVESNVKNLASALMNEQNDLIKQFIEHDEVVFSALSERKK